MTIENVFLYLIFTLTHLVFGFLIFVDIYIIVPSRLSPQWLCGNSCTWAHDVRLHIAGTNERKSVQQAKQGA